MIKHKKNIRNVILIIILLSGLPFSVTLAFQASLEASTSPQIYFDNFEALTEDRFVIAQLSGDMLAQIYQGNPLIFF